MKTKLLTIPELAVYFGKTRKQTYAMLDRHPNLPRLRFGTGFIRIDLDELRNWMCDEIENPNRKPGPSSGWRNRRTQNRLPSSKG